MIKRALEDQRLRLPPVDYDRDPLILAIGVALFAATFVTLFVLVGGLR